MRSYYIPSNKYLPSAPLIVLGFSFLSSAITGIVYGLLFSEFLFFSSINITCVLLGLGGAIYINCQVISKVIVKQQLRNPRLARLMSTIGVAFGWSLNWVAVYKISSFYGGDSDFINFVINRLMHGIPAAIGTEYGNSYFTGHWYLLFPSWLFEAMIMPYMVGRYAYIKAGFPFSEETLKWHRSIVLPLFIASPSKIEMRVLLERGDEECLLRVHPDRYQPEARDYGGWTRLTLFVLEKEGQVIYATLGGMILDRIFNFLWSDEYLLRYWSINQEESQILMKRLASKKINMINRYLTFC